MAIIQTSCTQDEALLISGSYPELIFYAEDTCRVVKNGKIYGYIPTSSPFDTDETGKISINLQTVFDGIFDTTKTESQVSLLTDDIMYLTTDTNNIILNGNVYGKGSEIENILVFSSDSTGQQSWDTNKIYVIPSSTDGVFDTYTYNNGSWSNTGSLSAGVPSNASGVKYELANTPSLGGGNMQSAVESVSQYYNEWMGNTFGDLTEIISDYTKKGGDSVSVSAMASIAGLGYDITEYLSFTKLAPVNKTGFKYGCSLKKRYDGKAMTTSSMFKENTSLVYMPVIDYTNTTDGTLYYMFYKCTNLVCMPPLNLPNKGNKSAHQAFAGCSKITRIPTLGNIQISTMQYFCASCSSLLYVPDITANTANVTNYQYAFTSCTKLLRIDGLDFTSANGTWAYNATYNMFRAGGGSCSVRYMLLKNFGKHSGLTGFMAKDAANWGVNSTDVPDARQSLVDSLLTYSFDRATAEYANCTVTLSAATLALLTEEEKTAITAKGYVLTSA